MAALPPKVYPVVEKHGENYRIFNDRPIGKGAYAEVYLGRTSSGRMVAVKTACKGVEILAIKTEVEILRKLCGAPNIVQYIGSINERMAPGSVPTETFSFAMEYAKSSLEAEMRRPENHRGLPADMLIDLVVDCSMALSALHRENIAHRDIKHMNILLFPGSPTRGRRSSALFKLCDMGCSKTLPEESSHEMRTLVGTPNLLHPYLAREMIDPRLERNQHDWRTQQPYTPEQCDLWSLGCTLYFCATGQFPFDHERNNKNLYYNAVNALTQNPDAIGMNPVAKGRHAGRREIEYEFEPIKELPAKYTQYPKWLVCTMTCLIRQFFHDPSIKTYAEIAEAMRNAKRSKFLSIDQLCIVDHTDMSKVRYVGFSVPSLSTCIGYPNGTDIRLISNTTTKYVDSKQKSVDGLNDDFYLVVPQTGQVNVRRIRARNVDFHEFEDMTDKKLAEIRLQKCYEGLSMLSETDEYCELFERVAKILSTQFLLLVEELSHFDRVQTTSRFAVYMDIATVPMMLSDGANSPAKKIAEQCIQQANQAREELDRHTKVAMDVEAMAKQLAKDSDQLSLQDVDLPGMREELESYFFYNKTDILETRDYSKRLLKRCYDRRQSVMQQIFKSPDEMQSSKLKKALDMAASLHRLRSDYQKLQNTISECVDLLEKPFQEMKDVVNRHLQEQGHSRNSMERSMHFLAPEFRKDQQRVKAATQTSMNLVAQLNQELEESIKQLGFVRLGDTLMAGEALEVAREQETQKTMCCQETSSSSEPAESPPRESIADVSVEDSCDESNRSYSTSASYTTSFESTPPSSPSQLNDSSYIQAIMQFFKKQPE